MATQVSQTAQVTDSSPKTVTTPAGTTLAYETYGVPDGEPLVFLHGMPGSRLLGELLADSAREHSVRVIAPDRPGFGQSERPQGFGLTDYESVLAPLLDAVGADEAAVAGFSAGASAALAAAATMPDRVTTVDLVSGSPPPEYVDDRPAIHRLLGLLATRSPRLLGAAFSLQARLARHRSADAVAAVYTADESPVAVPADVASVVKADFRESFAETTAGAIADARRIATAWPIDVTDVHQSVRLWHGTADHLTDVDDARAMASALPDASLTEFESHGHLGTVLAAREELLATAGR